jgi:hypothetical protein
MADLVQEIAMDVQIQEDEMVDQIQEAVIVVDDPVQEAAIVVEDQVLEDEMVDIMMIVLITIYVEYISLI